MVAFLLVGVPLLTVAFLVLIFKIEDKLNG